MAADVEQTVVQIGDHVRLTKNRIGTVRFIGEVEFAEGTFFGVELHNAKGNHNGSVKGKVYFRCQPNKGLLVKPNVILGTHQMSPHPPKERSNIPQRYQQVLTEHNVRKHTKREAETLHLPGSFPDERSNSPALSTNTEVASLTSSNLRRFDTIHPAKPIDPSKLPTIEQALAASDDKSVDENPTQKLFDIRSTSPSLKSPTEKSNPCLSELFLNKYDPATPPTTAPTTSDANLTTPPVVNIQPPMFQAGGLMPLPTIIKTHLPVPLSRPQDATSSPTTASASPRSPQTDIDNAENTPEQHLAGQLMKLNIRRRSEWDDPSPAAALQAAGVETSNQATCT